MLEEKNGRLTQIRASGMSDLLIVVVQQFQHYCSEAIQLKLKHQTDLTPETIGKECPENKSRVIISQTFTAMVVEAFYFDYKHGKESKSQATKWSKQSPVAQFVQLSDRYLFVKNSENTDLYNKLTDLNKLRKRLVHNESTSLGNYRKDLNYLTPIDCLDLLIELFAYFYKHDRECHTAKFTFDILSEVRNKANEPLN